MNIEELLEQVKAANEGQGSDVAQGLTPDPENRLAANCGKTDAQEEGNAEAIAELVEEIEKNEGDKMASESILMAKMAEEMAETDYDNITKQAEYFGRVSGEIIADTFLNKIAEGADTGVVNEYAEPAEINQDEAMELVEDINNYIEGQSMEEAEKAGFDKSAGKKGLSKAVWNKIKDYVGKGYSKGKEYGSKGMDYAKKHHYRTGAMVGGGLAAGGTGYAMGKKKESAAYLEFEEAATEKIASDVLYQVGALYIPDANPIEKMATGCEITRNALYALEKAAIGGHFYSKARTVASETARQNLVRRLKQFGIPGAGGAAAVGVGLYGYSKLKDKKKAASDNVITSIVTAYKNGEISKKAAAKILADANK